MLKISEYNEVRCMVEYLDCLRRPTALDERGEWKSNCKQISRSRRTQKLFDPLQGMDVALSKNISIRIRANRNEHRIVARIPNNDISDQC